MDMEPQLHLSILDQNKRVRMAYLKSSQIWLQICEKTNAVHPFWLSLSFLEKTNGQKCLSKSPELVHQTPARDA